VHIIVSPKSAFETTIASSRARGRYLPIIIIYYSASRIIVPSISVLASAFAGRACPLNSIAVVEAINRTQSSQ